MKIRRSALKRACISACEQELNVKDPIWVSDVNFDNTGLHQLNFWTGPALGRAYWYKKKLSQDDLREIKDGLSA